MDDLSRKLDDIQLRVKILEDEIASEKRNNRDLVSELANVRSSFVGMVTVFAIENFTLKRLLDSATERKAACEERNLALREEIITLNQRVTALEQLNAQRLSGLQIQGLEINEWKQRMGKMEDEVGKMEDEVVTIKSRASMWEQRASMWEEWEEDRKRALVRQLAWDLERIVRIFLINNMDAADRAYYVYKDDNSFIENRVDSFEYRDLIFKDARVRELVLKEFFENGMGRYKRFVRTMVEMKKLYNAFAHPCEDTDGKPVTKTTLLSYLETVTLSEEAKRAAGEYLSWKYPT